MFFRIHFARFDFRAIFGKRLRKKEVDKLRRRIGKGFMNKAYDQSKETMLDLSLKLIFFGADQAQKQALIVPDGYLK